MWEKPEHLKSVAVARPLRVAYLIALDTCPHAILDAIFAESYSRWGGRRTLIVPATQSGIDTGYADWLYYYDADVIYSFVDLTDDAVATLHERYGPAYLVRHYEPQVTPDQEPRYRIELPIGGMSSLTVLPAFLERARRADGSAEGTQVLNRFRAESPFLLENFGFHSQSFGGWRAKSAFPELHTDLLFVTENVLQDRHFYQDKRNTYLTSESAVLDALGERRPLITVAQLSGCFTPYLETLDNHQEGTCIIVGDTLRDRVLFWNVYQRHSVIALSEIATLRLSTKQAHDDEFVQRVGKILDLRGLPSWNRDTDHISVISCSVTQAELEVCAARLRIASSWRTATVRHHADPVEIAPTFADPERVRWQMSHLARIPDSKATTEFQGRRAPIPLAVPWHAKESVLPPGLRDGNWMVDLFVDRFEDHDPYSNKRDRWALPRRLRMERAFELDVEYEREHHHEVTLLRVQRSGALTTNLNQRVSRAAVSAPTDLDALRFGLCNKWEWSPFDQRSGKGPQGRQRFAEAELSDEGRYLIGVLALFDGITDAFSVLMSGYWRGVLQHLGAVATDRDASKRDELIKVLRRRLRQPKGALKIEGDDQLNRLAEEAMRAARTVGRASRHISYGQLKSRWEKFALDYDRANPEDRAGDVESEGSRLDGELDRSIQYLCQREVLYQGREWQCRSCFNRNWLGIDDLKSTMVCSVCGRQVPAPVAGEWDFRPNPFLIEAYREHGIEAVIWSLWQLADRWRHASFYFAPSLKLWVDRPESSRAPWDVEVDAIVVLDGKVYLIEAKTSGGLDDSEVAKLVLAAERVRPDVLLLACMDNGGAALERATEKLKAVLPAGVAVEVTTFNKVGLDRFPFLPG